MLRALWFLLRVTALVGAVVWFMRHPGTVQIGWQGYIVETSIGFVALALTVFLLLYTYAYSLWRALAHTPRLWRRYQQARKREFGYRDVTAGLVAVAAGDARAAQKYAKRGERMIPDAPLAKLLTAQSHLLNGNAPKARLAFAELLDDAGAAFFGVKAMLQETLQAGDHRAALEHIRSAEKMQPGRVWIARTLFDLEARNREWVKAGKALKKCVRLGIFNHHEAISHSQALLLAEADELYAGDAPVPAHHRAAEAFALNPAFAPAALRLVKFYTHVGKTKSALKVIERGFAAAPHPALAAAWMSLAPAPKKPLSPYDQGRVVFDWAQRLYKLSPDHRDALRMMGAAALEGRRFLEARDYLTRAADYRGLAKLEKAETGNEAKARSWLEAAAEMPPDSKWTCTSCGYGATEWTALCPRCGAFNASVWAVPEDAPRAIPLHKAMSGDVLGTSL